MPEIANPVIGGRVLGQPIRPGLTPAPAQPNDLPPFETRNFLIVLAVFALPFFGYLFLVAFSALSYNPEMLFWVTALIAALAAAAYILAFLDQRVERSELAKKVVFAISLAWPAVVAALQLLFSPKSASLVFILFAYYASVVVINTLLFWGANRLFNGRADFKTILRIYAGCAAIAAISLFAYLVLDAWKKSTSYSEPSYATGFVLIFFLAVPVMTIPLMYFKLRQATQLSHWRLLAALLAPSAYTLITNGIIIIFLYLLVSSLGVPVGRTH